MQVNEIINNTLKELKTNREVKIKFIHQGYIMGYVEQYFLGCNKYKVTADKDTITIKKKWWNR